LPAVYCTMASPVPSLITVLLVISFGAYVVVLLAEAIRQRSIRSVWREMSCLAAAFLILRWSVGFPSSRESFSSATPIVAILLMYLCIIFGMTAEYLFNLKEGFSWLSFIKPFMVSPIVLLPLIGTLQTNSGIEPIQLISLALLAFQNGFFWRPVLDRAKRRIK